MLKYNPSKRWLLLWTKVSLLTPVACRRPIGCTCTRYKSVDHYLPYSFRADPSCTHQSPSYLHDVHLGSTQIVHLRDRRLCSSKILLPLPDGGGGGGRFRHSWIKAFCFLRMSSLRFFFKVWRKVLNDIVSDSAVCRTAPGLFNSRINEYQVPYVQ